MNIAVFGTGMVGTTVAKKLVELGHSVKLGSRTADNERAAAWAAPLGERATHGTYAEAAAFGDIAFNCTNGAGTLAALEAAGAENLEGKILVDLSNPLDVSNGMPPTLFVFNDDSLGERVQRALPKTRVVKTLNTINAELMIDASRVPAEHTVFVSGDDAEAKAEVQRMLRDWFGHRDVLDLGDITTARGVEAYLPLWLRLWGALGTADFNIKVERTAEAKQ